ncbi:MAG: hypothetical protein ACRDAW_02590 [Metamycoplasmataceae bacterium]
MNKKLLISLSSVSIAAVGLPILSTISCSSEAPAIVNLTISAKANPRITNDDITTLERNNLHAQLIVLQKLFDGKDLTATHQKNFSISISRVRRVVTLNAKSGYTIDGKNNLVSHVYALETNPPADTDLKITLKPSPKLTKEDIAALKGANNSAQLAALKKLFEGEGLTSANQDKFTILVDESKKIVTLTAKSGYTIDGKNTLASNAYADDTTPPTDTDLKITVKTGTIDLTSIDLLDLSGNEVTKQKVVLNKLFDGITDSNFNNFTFKINNNNIVLTAKQGYNFSSNPTLNKNYSPINSAINITVKSGTPRLTKTEIAKLKEPPIPANAADQLSLLSRVFNGIDSTNQNFFTIEVDEIFTTLALKTKPGFVIGTGPNSKLTQIVSIFQYNGI